MVDLTEHEQIAIRHALKMVAEVMEEIGWESRLIDLSEGQVLTIIEVALGGFQEASILIWSRTMGGLITSRSHG